MVRQQKGPIQIWYNNVGFFIYEKHDCVEKVCLYSIFVIWLFNYVNSP